MAQWFESWFDTEYYHMLYNKRNDEEAEAFISGLFAALQLREGMKVADIACGKGRHSRVMAKSGMQVYGYDLSKNSIDCANSLATPGCRFFVHDIRNPYEENGFDAALNLFTSFGYFDTDEEDIIAIKNIYDMLKPGGIFVQDYLNAFSVIPQFPCKGTENRENIHFDIQKRLENRHIIKEIEVTDGEKRLNYAEKVKTYSETELKDIHQAAGFKILRTAGDYQLHPYESGTSPRLIIISQKP